ncbi:ABC transporter permease subunit [Streptosporangium sp. LJ11]|uniref:carbohydrate ABC transporter permease n=1 Tax=Streptosporangium sp. LJ11 TaxID=3436927 RepID=UPI003F7958B1
MVVTTPARRDAPEKPDHRRAAKRRRSDGFTAFLMTAPAVVLLILFIAVPVVLAFYLSFTNSRLISPDPPRMTGTQNIGKLLSVSVLDQHKEPGATDYPPVRDYTRKGSGYPQYEEKSVLFTYDSSDEDRTVVLAGDPTFWKSLRNTFLFALVVVPVQGGLGLLLALLVNARLRGIRIFRTLYFMPVVTSMVVVSILWRFMYQPDGLINSMLGTLTFGSWDAVDWLGNAQTAMPAIMLMSVWQGVGFHMVVWLAGLQTIPPALYEAAKIDGAARLQLFRHITWPCLRPTRVFVIVTITLAALGLFTQIDVMTQGGPLDATTTVVYHAVRKGFREQQIGYGAAISLVFFLLVLAVNLVQRRLLRERT